jgi:L-ascorbate metabolism protein UlaG (beta-lactamase superfamily)
VIKPVLQDDLFLEDVFRAKSHPDQLHLWWLGQSGYLLQWHKRHLLIDPYLSDSLTKKYANKNKPHVRMTERVIAPERLDFVDVVTSSHNHTDHLDGETLIPLLQANPTLTVLVSRANINFAAERLKVSSDRLTPISVNDTPLIINSISFTAIPSAHEILEKDEHGEQRFIGFVINIGKWSLYHSGDCVPYDGLAQRLIQMNIDIALLPINGRDPSRGVAGNFNGKEAVSLAKEIGAGLLIPCHYEMFEFNTVPPDEFIQAAQDMNQPYQILKCGERLSLVTS